jgi:hypothetical protein
LTKTTTTRATTSHNGKGKKPYHRGEKYESVKTETSNSKWRKTETTASLTTASLKTATRTTATRTTATTMRARTGKNGKEKWRTIVVKKIKHVDFV